jgi:hypothetical protein
VLENRVLRRIFEYKRDEVTRDWKKNYIMRNLMICYPHSVFLGDKIEKIEMGVRCSTHGEEERSVQGCSGEN